MQIYNVGPDGFSESDFEFVLRDHAYHWVVIWYFDERWSGWGELVALGMDGLIHYKDLGHCSCYGPLDEWEQCGKMTVEEFLREKDSIHDIDFRKEVNEKVRSLLLG